MKVTLLTCTPDPDQLVAAAARLCYSGKDPAAILQGLTADRQKELLARLRAAGHDSPLEHASFTFIITGVSRALSHQLVRHRIASYSQRSQRYVSEAGFTYVVPPSVRRSPVAEERFHHLIEEIREAYNSLVELGVPHEDARYLLPNACTTQLMMTMNARSLLNFLELRCCRRAQWEINCLAWKIRSLLQDAAPLTFALAGPACLVRGKCREGKHTCGQPYTREEAERLGKETEEKP
ncbi:MAG TPA: FAD-dependent thymidylate synthase [Firmicutes bacterium]|jgi:thymidylate synthase (FAD)|nr:FAD-dependent thymidylate synthase [Bacillota bacterium]